VSGVSSVSGKRSGHVSPLTWRQEPLNATRAALHVRVSTGGQTTENQRPELEQFARSRRLAVVATFEEAIGTGKRRPVFARMMDDAKRGA
jgi:hypothetical protein